MKQTFTDDFEHRGATIREKWILCRSSKPEIIIEGEGRRLSSKQVEMKDVPDEILEEYRDCLKAEYYNLQTEIDELNHLIYEE